MGIFADELFPIAEQYADTLNQMGDVSSRRMQQRIEESYEELLEEIADSWDAIAQNKSIIPQQQRLLLAEELGELMQVIRPGMAEGELERILEEAVRDAAGVSDRYYQAIQRVVNRNDSIRNTLQATTGIPLDALQNQTEEGMRRLYRHGEDQASKISAIVENGLIQNRSVRAVMNDIESTIGLTRYQAERIARTEIMGSFGGGAIGRAIEDGALIQWISFRDEYTCRVCSARNMRVYRPQDITYPVHPFCLVGDTVISSPAIKGGTSRQYSGQVITLETASGKKLTATPNHPILTDQGWTAIHLIHEGDDVFSCVDSEGAARAVTPDHYQGPAKIGEVVTAFHKSSRVASTRVKVAPEYFHGDGEGSDVCVVSRDRFLRDEVFGPQLLQPTQHDSLLVRLIQAFALNGQRPLDLFFNSDRSASRSLPSFFSPRLPLFFRHVSPFHKLSFALVADMDARALQNAPNTGSLNLELLRHLVFGHASTVSVNDVIPDLCVPLSKSFTSLSRLQSFIFGGSSLQPPLFQRPANEFPINPDLASSSLNRLTGKVYRDRVIKTSVSHFNGPVYNLETETGWYLASDIVTHNCRCNMVPIFEEWLDDDDIIDASDREFMTEHRKTGLDTLRKAGKSPNYGAGPFDVNGAPKPVWSP